MKKGVECNRELMKTYMRKYFNKRNKPIAKLIDTTDRIRNNRQAMIEKLHKMLDRVELDRP